MRLGSGAAPDSGVAMLSWRGGQSGRATTASAGCRGPRPAGGRRAGGGQVRGETERNSMGELVRGGSRAGARVLVKAQRRRNASRCRLTAGLSGREARNPARLSGPWLAAIAGCGAPTLSRASGSPERGKMLVQRSGASGKWLEPVMHFASRCPRSGTRERFAELRTEAAKRPTSDKAHVGRCRPASAGLRYPLRPRVRRRRCSA